MERDAFKELEDAMISASMPKKERLAVMGEINDGPSGVQNRKQS